MNKNDSTTKNQDRPVSQEQNFYQTGSTCPPKSYRGLVAFLLIAVIFLSGIVSLQGIMNIHMFRQLTDQEASRASVRFIPRLSTHETSTGEDASSSITVSPLGIEGSVLSTFDQQFYSLPQGVYITQVFPTSDAAEKGICTGDVLLSIDGVCVTDAEMMLSQLSTCQPGDTVHVVIYHGGVRQPMELIIE